MNRMKKILASLLAILLLITGIGQTSVLAEDPPTTGTITVNNATKGQDYILYKLFDATVGDGGISYKVPSGKTLAADNTWFSQDSKGNVTAKSGADLTSDAFKTWAAGFGTQVTSKTADGNPLVFSGLAFGYYYIKSGLGAVLTVDSTTPNATVNDKNTTTPVIPPEGLKKIVNGTAFVDEVTAKIGDEISYQVKFQASNFETTSATDTKQITEYKIVDTASDLAIVANSVLVKVGTQTVAITPTISTDGVMTLIIPWVDASGASLYNAPVDVTVTYKAIVKAGAHDGEASNKAVVTYKTKGNDTDIPIPDPDPDPGTKVKTYQFTLTKTDGTKTLTGAKFRLFDAASAGTEIKVVKEGDFYRVAEATETGVEIEAGTALVKGLKGDNTVYYLEETVAPNGYNILTNRQAVKITSDQENKVDVENKKGVELPSTGSIGTTLFYLLGASMLIGLFVYVITKRRMSKL